MRHSSKRIFLAAALSLLMIVSQTVFAGEPVQAGKIPGRDYVREVPALQDNAPGDSDQAPSPQEDPSPGQDLESWRNPSPLSLPDDKLFNLPKNITKEEGDEVLNRLSELVGTLSMGQRLSEAQALSLSEAGKTMQSYLKNSNAEGTAFDTLKKVGTILIEAFPDTNGPSSPMPDASDRLAQRFVNVVMASVQMARRLVAEDASLPDARAFSAGESPQATLEEKAGSRGVLDPSLQSPKDQVLSSVALNRETAKTYQIVNPPQKLHPFVRWLFYGRHLTQDRANRYLAARAKVRSILLRAKAGEGLIRYKGQVMEMFLPLPGDESGGTFELIRRI